MIPPSSREDPVVKSVDKRSLAPNKGTKQINHHFLHQSGLDTSYSMVCDSDNQESGFH